MMSSTRTLIVISLLFLVTYRIHASLTCQILYGALRGYNASAPTALYCAGKGNDGNWTKLENGTEHLIARFNKTTVDLQRNGYNVTVLEKNNGVLLVFLNLTYGDNGIFACTIGNEKGTLHVPMLLNSGGIAQGLNVSLQCMPLNKNINISDPAHESPHPYNLTWFLNSTMVGRVQIYNDTSYNVTYYTSTSFVQHKNVTFHSNWGHTNTTIPACLTCVLGENSSFGFATICSPNTTDLTINRSNMAEVISHNKIIQLKVTKDEGKSDVAGAPTGGATILIGSVLIVCAIAGTLFLLHVKKKGRSDIRPPRITYRSFNDLSVNIDE